MSNDSLITAREVSKILGLHINTVKKMRLPYYRVTDRGDRRYKLQEILDYLNSRRVEK